MEKGGFEKLPLREAAYLSYQETKSRLLSIPGITQELAEDLASLETAKMLTPRYLSSRGYIIDPKIVKLCMETHALGEELHQMIEKRKS